MHGVEFGHCGIDVVDVEPHLLCDSTIVAETHYLKHFVAGCPRTRVGSGRLQSDESDTFASDRDEFLVEPHHARLEVTPHLVWPLGGRYPDRRKADDLPATLHGNLWCKQLLHSVSIVAVDSGYYAFAHLRALVDRRGTRHFERVRRGVIVIARTKDGARPFNKRPSAFPLIQIGRALGGC